MICIKVLLKEYTNISQPIEICTYSSRNKQYVEGGRKRKKKKAYLRLMDSIIVITMSYLLLKKQKKRERGWIN